MFNPGSTSLLVKAELLFFYLFIFFHEKQKRRTQYVFCIKWKLGKNPGLISVAHNDSVVLMYWKQFLGNIQIGWRKNISDMWRSKLKVDFHCSVILTSVNRIETMYGRPRVNVKEGPRSTYTLTRGLSYIGSVSFTRVNFTCVHT